MPMSIPVDRTAPARVPRGDGGAGPSASPATPIEEGLSAGVRFTGAAPRHDDAIDRVAAIWMERERARQKLVAEWLAAGDGKRLAPVAGVTAAERLWTVRQLDPDSILARDIARELGMLVVFDPWAVRS